MKKITVWAFVFIFISSQYSNPILCSVLKTKTENGFKINETEMTFEHVKVSLTGHLTSTSTTSPLYRVLQCVDCIRAFKDCSLPLIQITKVIDDPCCQDLCLRKYPLHNAHDAMGPDTKSYTVLDRVNIMGKNTSVCLCLHDFLPKSDIEHQSSSEIPQYVEYDSKVALEFDGKPQQLCSSIWKCQAVDKFQTVWEECPGRVHVKSCPRNGIGTARWNCLENGTFQGPQPDFDNCKSRWLTELQDEANLSPRLSSPSAEGLLDKTLRQLNAESNGKTVSPFFESEFNTIVDFVAQVNLRANESNLMKLESLTSKSVHVFDAILIQTQSQDRHEGARKATNLLKTLEGNVFGLSKTSVSSARQLKPDENYEKVFAETKSYKVTTGAIGKSTVKKKSEFLGWNTVGTGGSDHVSCIKLPNGWENQIPGNHALYAGIKITDKHVKELFPEKLGSAVTSGDRASVINGPIMSLSVSNPNAEILPIKFQGQGARITFYHDTPASVGHSDANIRRKLYPDEIRKAVSESSVCVYWDVSNLVWSTAGCKLVEVHAKYTICECQHLTAFAVLMDMHNYVGKDVGLITLTFILCIFSAVFLLISIIIFSTVRSARSPRTSLTIHLCICLLIGNILVISVMDRNNFNMSSGVCAASAIITHYVFLCAFAWMAIEGFVVYKMLVDVFDSGTDNKKLLNGIAYGVPFVFVLLFVIIHVASEDQVYGGEMYCWLVGGYIWSFIAPVFLVVAGNIIVMGIAMTKVYQLNRSTIQVKKKAKSFRTWIIGSLSLTFLLGLTWVFGALLLISNAKFANVAAYIFTIFNASQGFFIFIFHCVMNENVRVVFRRKMGRGIVTTSQSQSRSDKPTEVKMAVTATMSTSVSAPSTSEEERFEIKREFLRTKSESSETSQTSQISRKPAFLRYLDNKRASGRNSESDNGFM